MRISGASKDPGWRSGLDIEFSGVGSTARALLVSRLEEKPSHWPPELSLELLADHLLPLFPLIRGELGLNLLCRIELLSI